MVIKRAGGEVKGNCRKVMKYYFGQTLCEVWKTPSVFYEIWYKETEPAVHNVWCQFCISHESL